LQFGFLRVASDVQHAAAVFRVGVAHGGVGENQRVIVVYGGDGALVWLQQA
jgi:hypothetical protein